MRALLRNCGRLQNIPTSLKVVATLYLEMKKDHQQFFFHRTSQPKFQMSFKRNQKHRKLRRKTKFLEGNRIVHCEEVFHSLDFYLEVLKIPPNVPQIFLDNGANFVFRMLIDQTSTRIKTQTFVGTFSFCFNAINFAQYFIDTINTCQ